MKNLMVFLLIGTFLLSISSCSDDENPIANVELEGTLWTGTGYVATGCDDPNDNDNSPNYTCTETDCETLYLENGTVTIIEIRGDVIETITASYTLSGNVVTVTIEENGQTVTFDINYTIVGDVLTLNFTFPLDGCDVIQTYKAAE